MSYECALPFDTNATQFVRGFEAGRLWERISNGETFEQTIHASNAEMVLRMAEATDATVRGHILDDTWMTVTVEQP